ncbi:MAG: SAVED domain-containing protein [Litoreibacter sp.]|nr:SAVED domain-containing protein [Litoreibacter sp.]MCY4335953.1 SAVED domain-containing protein [Litoreibacter sp.]
MVQAITARRDGDIYQARQFWIRAAFLLDPESPIVRIGFEDGPKSFDDIWVEYAHGREPKDARGAPICREHLQCKWHVTPGVYGYSNLIDPTFINANARSFMQRARDAQMANAPNGTGVRFKMVTNWQADRQDYLSALVSSQSGSVRLDRLFGTKTDSSKAGAIRKAWREHLEIDDDELRVFVNTLAFGHTSENLDDLRARCDLSFRIAGLKRVPTHHSSFIYDDVVFQWMSQGRVEFEKESFRDACADEDLFGQSMERPKIYGVKSFEHPLDRLEDRCDDVLNLVPVFDQRYIRDEEDWSKTLYPALESFLQSAARDQRQLDLALDAHTTLAFAAGSVLNIKSGRAVGLEQRTLARQIWAADDVPNEDDWPTLNKTILEVDPHSTDIAFAVGITHDIANDVRQFVSKHLPKVGRLIVFRPSSGSGAQVIKSGSHAFAFSQTVKEGVRSIRSESATRALSHLFIAAPNALTFFLGQQASALGPLTLYEFDFEGARDGSYRKSLTLPITQQGSKMLGSKVHS